MVMLGAQTARFRQRVFVKRCVEEVLITINKYPLSIKLTLQVICYFLWWDPSGFSLGNLATWWRIGEKCRFLQAALHAFDRTEKRTSTLRAIKDSVSSRHSKLSLRSTIHRAKRALNYYVKIGLNYESNVLMFRDQARIELSVSAKHVLTWAFAWICRHFSTGTKSIFPRRWKQWSNFYQECLRMRGDFVVIKWIAVGLGSSALLRFSGKALFLGRYSLLERCSFHCWMILTMASPQPVRYLTSKVRCDFLIPSCE